MIYLYSSHCIATRSKAAFPLSCCYFTSRLPQRSKHISVTAKTVLCLCNYLKCQRSAAVSCQKVCPVMHMISNRIVPSLVTCYRCINLPLLTCTCQWSPEVNQGTGNHWKDKLAISHGNLPPPGFLGSFVLLLPAGETPLTPGRNFRSSILLSASSDSNTRAERHLLLSMSTQAAAVGII
jgi:hypothetical protein